MRLISEVAGILPKCLRHFGASDRNGDGINLIICYFTLVYLQNSNNNKSSSADKVTL